MIKKQRSEEMEDGEEEEEEGHWEDWEIAGKSLTAYQSSARDGGRGDGVFSGINNVYIPLSGGRGQWRSQVVNRCTHWPVGSDQVIIG